MRMMRGGMNGERGEGEMLGFCCSGVAVDGLLRLRILG